MINILLPAFLISLALLGIHSYFGIRIIRRGIIFADLAIGQMAALGAAFSLMLFEGAYPYVFSLSFALLGGLFISLASKKDIQLEAFIGLLYAFGISSVFILLSKSPHGMEEFQNLMAYDILFTQMADVLKTVVLYSFLGGVIILYERKTKDYIKELLFFLTLAATVTMSVKVAGVLVVFAILLAPAFIAIKLSSKNWMPAFLKKHIILTAWTIGVLVNLAAIVVSYGMDFPTGYTLVFSHALASLFVAFA